SSTPPSTSSSRKESPSMASRAWEWSTMENRYREYTKQIADLERIYDGLVDALVSGGEDPADAASRILHPGGGPTAPSAIRSEIDYLRKQQDILLDQMYAFDPQLTISTFPATFDFDRQEE